MFDDLLMNCDGEKFNKNFEFNKSLTKITLLYLGKGFEGITKSLSSFGHVLVYDLRCK